MPATAPLPRTRSNRPRLRCTDDVLSYWAERIEQVAPEREHFSYSSMICEGDSLFHYGHHFELARIIRDKRGRTRLVLLNGDRYAGSGGFGPSTASRQASTRSAVECSSAPSLVVPFSALEGAEIDFDSIRPIHVRDDRWTYEDRSSRVAPTTKRARMAHPDGHMTVEDQWQYDNRTGRSERVSVEVPVYVDNPNVTRPFGGGDGWAESGAERGEDGIWRWTVRRHWLGDSIFRARCTVTRSRPLTAEEQTTVERCDAWDRELRRLHALQSQLPHRVHRQDGKSSGRYEYGRMFRLMLTRQRLMEMTDAHHDRKPIRPAIRNGRIPYRVTRWATFLSSFDYQERMPLYFLCELPYGAKPGTVDEAIEALKPPEVVAALARGLNVIRQGDLFAIPTKLTKRQLRRMMGRDGFTKRLRVLGTNHSVTEGVVCKGGAVLGRGVMRHEPESWRPPDHASVTLGKAWHLLVRNTVPRTN